MRILGKNVKNAAQKFDCQQKHQNYQLFIRTFWLPGSCLTRNAFNRIISHRKISNAGGGSDVAVASDWHNPVEVMFHFNYY